MIDWNSKEDRIDVQTYLSSLHCPTEEKRYLNDDQIVEFTNPEFTSINVMFHINNRKDEVIWYTQLNQIIVKVSEKGEFKGIFLPCFPIQGEKKTLWNIKPDDFWSEVKGKKYKVTSVSRSIVINQRAKTIYDKNLQNYGEVVKYVERCITEDRITNLGDILRYANIYGFERV